jgi:Concanavalin A-like lectin/glucanases superfamily/Secretion system C-terminal sorting domain
MQQTSASQYSSPNSFAKRFSIAAPLGGLGRLFVRFLLLISLVSTGTFSHAQPNVYRVYNVYLSELEQSRLISISIGNGTVNYKYSNQCSDGDLTKYFGIYEWFTQSTVRFPLHGFINFLPEIMCDDIEPHVYCFTYRFFWHDLTSLNPSYRIGLPPNMIYTYSLVDDNMILEKNGLGFRGKVFFTIKALPDFDGLVGPKKIYADNPVSLTLNNVRAGTYYIDAIVKTGNTYYIRKISNNFTTTGGNLTLESFPIEQSMLRGNSDLHLVVSRLGHNLDNVNDFGLPVTRMVIDGSDLRIPYIETAEVCQNNNFTVSVDSVPAGNYQLAIVDTATANTVLGTISSIVNMSSTGQLSINSNALQASAFPGGVLPTKFSYRLLKDGILYTDFIEKSVKITNPENLDLANSAVSNAIGCGNTAVITTATSQAGKYYVLEDNATGIRLSAPQPGTGAALSIATAPLYANTTIRLKALQEIGYLRFDGTNDYITTPATLQGTSGTWEAWVKKDSWANHNDDILFSNGLDYGTDGSMYVSLHPYGLHFRYGGQGQAGNNIVFTPVTKGFVANTWHHLAATWQNTAGTTTLKLYVDGVLAATNTSTLTLGNSPNIKLGGNGINGAYFGSGSMYDIRLWNTAKSADVIATNYFKILTGSETGLIAHYKLNETTGSTAADASPNNNTGTLTNFIVPAAWSVSNSCNSPSFVMSQMQNIVVGSTLPINMSNIAVSTASNSLCPNTAATITTPTSQAGLYYLLENSATGTRLSAPQMSTGAPLNITTTPLTANTTIRLKALQELSRLGFDGTNDYIATPATLQGSSGTWEAWVQKDNWANHHDDVLLSNGLTDTQDGSMYVSLHPSVGFHFRYGGQGQSGNNYISTLVTQGFVPNSWHHLAATWFNNGATTILTLYVDGVFQAAISCPLLLGNSTNVKLGGSGIIGATNYFGSGSMYDIRLWNTTKSADDIATNYFKILTGSETGLIANYKLNETVGTAAADVSPNNNKGTLTNFGVPTAWTCNNTSLIMSQTQSITVDAEAAALANTNISQTLVLNNPTDIKFVNGCTDYIAKLTPNGSNPPLYGFATAKVWIEGTQLAQYVKRHYEITPASNAATATAQVKLFFTQQEFNDFNAVNATKLPTSSSDAAGKANLVIEKRSGTSSDNSGLPASYPSSTSVIINPNDADIVWNATTNRWEVSFDVTGFSGFFVTASSTVLPIELLNFTGKNTEGGNLLTWTTANEKNNKGFDIERSSDSKTFEKIGFQAGHGTTNAANTYSFSDTYPVSFLNYYRLKQIDFDGKVEYSKVISIENKGKQTHLKVYPNPTAEGRISLEIPENTEGVTIFNAIGQIIFQQQVKGQNLLPIDVSAWAQGVYFIKTNDNTEGVKFVKN